MICLKVSVVPCTSMRVVLLSVATCVLHKHGIVPVLLTKVVLLVKWVKHIHFLYSFLNYYKLTLYYMLMNPNATISIKGEADLT
jgi:hypothetical protein